MNTRQKTREGLAQNVMWLCLWFVDPCVARTRARVAFLGHLSDDEVDALRVERIIHHQAEVSSLRGA